MANLIATLVAATVCINGHPAPRPHITFPAPFTEPHRGYERDHIIPLCLGGANASDNLWYQPIEEARRKDAFEWEICERYCAGLISLEDARAFFEEGKWR